MSNTADGEPHTADESTIDENTTDAESFSDALLDLVEDVAAAGETAVWDGVTNAMKVAEKLGIDFVRRYHRLEIDGHLEAPTEQVLFVANHGFGGIFDLNVFALAATMEELEPDRPLTVLTHQSAWTLKIGPLLETIGCQPASPEVAADAFGRGDHVCVLPGGDLDAFKSFGQRNDIVFGGRVGFARLALKFGVPIVPIVTAGAGESLFVLSSGKRLARALQLDKILRLKALPVTVSLPWGVNVGGVGLLPYLPLPSKLLTRVLPAITPSPSETPEELAARVELAMQDALSEMAASRRPWSR